ncbi:hypothetical protein GCM10011339_42110 [Echinicola rosea]|uniref:Uncharacterized protein n=1 Tax=Echinicola rosea TaxID=1807691 RepID=A0ABQ1VAH5_9BACT|nr:hypothetical protein GCM10011339_42110 [Echinicola rosea]
MDNSSFKSEMNYQEKNGNSVFSTKESSSFDKWIILKDGKLEVRDNLGLIYTARQISN